MSGFSFEPGVGFGIARPNWGLGLGFGVFGFGGSGVCNICR